MLRLELHLANRLDFSTNSEKIKELANGSMQDTSGPWFVGHPINIFWDYKYDRIWQDTPEDNKMMQLYQKIGNLTFLRTV